MNGHERATRLAAFAIDFPLSPVERRELEGHLASCLSCRAFDAGIRSDASSLRAIARHPAPTRVRDAVVASTVAGSVERRWALVVQLASVLLAAALVLVALGLGALIGGRTTEVVPVKPLGLRVSATILAAAETTPGEPPPEPLPGEGLRGITGAAFGEGSVWVTTERGVDRVDPATNAVVATITLGAHPTRIAFGGGAVWVTVTGDGQVARIDPGTNGVTAKITVGRQPVGIAFADGSVWVAVRLEKTLLRIDPSTNGVVARIPLGASPLNVASTPGAIWVTSDQGSGFSAQSPLLRIDPTSNTIGATIPAGTGGMGADSELVAQADSVWFLLPGIPSVSRLDVRTNRVTARIAVRGDASGLALGGGYLWVFSSQGVVERIDPATSAIIDEVSFALRSDALWQVSGTYGAGSAWVRSYDPGSVIRIELGR